MSQFVFAVLYIFFTWVDMSMRAVIRAMIIFTSFTSCEMEHSLSVFPEHILIKHLLDILKIFFKDHTVFGVKC